MKPLPHDVESLIRELESIYPPRCIEPLERIEDAHRYAGHVELIAALRARFDWTRANSLPQEILSVLRRS